MGYWKIEVEGHGTHLVADADVDADHAAREFIKALRKQGHTIKRATFTLVSDQPDDLNVVDDAPPDKL